MKKECVTFYVGIETDNKKETAEKIGRILSEELGQKVGIKYKAEESFWRTKWTKMTFWRKNFTVGE